MLIRDFARKLTALPSETGWQTKTEDALRLGSRYQNKWYRTQREHWLGWLGDYHTPGAYKRKTASPKDVRAVYNRINHVPMLMWLAEALQVAEDKLQSAYNEVCAAGTTSTAQAGAFRRVIDWSQIDAKLSVVTLSDEQIQIADQSVADAVARLRSISPAYR